MMTANDFGCALANENGVGYEEFRVSVSKFPVRASDANIPMGSIKEGIRIQYPNNGSSINPMRASSNCKNKV